MDNEDIVFNLDFPDNPENAENDSVLFWNKYSDCINKVRNNCAGDTELLDGFRRTRKDPDPNRPLFNLTFETTEDDDFIEVTFKCRKHNIYMIGVRKGRGDPQLGPNSQNIDPWRECRGDGYNHIQGAIKLDFTGSYNQNADDLGVGNWIGFQTLRNAIIGIWHGINLQKNFLTVVIHISEPARFEYFMAYFRRCNLHEDMYVQVVITPMLRVLIKEWSTISKAIQRHLVLDEPFVIEVEELKHWTLEYAKNAMAVLLYINVTAPKK